MRRRPRSSAPGAGRERAGPGHRVVHCLNYKLWMGGYTDHATLEATGAAVIPFGVGDTELWCARCRSLKITAISCTPSYPAVLERVIAEKFPGLKPRDLGLQLGLFGGEAGLDNPEFRGRLHATWGFTPRNANYGVSDVFCNFAGQSEVDTDLHFMALDVLHPELVQPDTGAVLPWREGRPGRAGADPCAAGDAQPLVRFRTGDIVLLDRHRPGSAVGRTAPRFRVVGRSDDMVVVRGLNAFPAQVASAILNREACVERRVPHPCSTGRVPTICCRSKSNWPKESRAARPSPIGCRADQARPGTSPRA